MRIALALAMLFLGASAVRVPAWVSFGLLAGVVMASYVELKRRREQNLLHNLGMPVLLIVAISAVPAIVAESTIGFLQSMSR
jgi:hypothetical protein